MNLSLLKVLPMLCYNEILSQHSTVQPSSWFGSKPRGVFDCITVVAGFVKGQLCECFCLMWISHLLWIGGPPRYETSGLDKCFWRKQSKNSSWNRVGESSPLIGQITGHIPGHILKNNRISNLLSKQAARGHNTFIAGYQHFKRTAMQSVDET